MKWSTTPVLLTLILTAQVMTAMTIWQLKGSIQAFITQQQEQEVPSQTSNFTIEVTDGASTFKIDFEVTTTFQEIDSSETEAAWLTRHMDTVKAAKNKAEGYDLDT